MLLTALLLASADAEAQEIKNITTEVVNVEDVSVDLNGAHFTVVLEMTRHRGPATKLKSLEYEIVIADQVVGTAVYDEKQRLKKGEPVQLRVPVDVGVAAGPAILRSVGAGDASVTVRGEAKVKVFIFTKTRPFETTYTL